MERIHLEFDFTDSDIVDIIAGSTPPDDVKVGKPATIIKASAASGGGIFAHIAIQFPATKGVGALGDCIQTCQSAGQKFQMLFVQMEICE